MLHVGLGIYANMKAGLIKKKSSKSASNKIPDLSYVSKTAGLLYLQASKLPVAWQNSKGIYSANLAITAILEIAQSLQKLEKCLLLLLLRDDC